MCCNKEPGTELICWINDLGQAICSLYHFKDLCRIHVYVLEDISGFHIGCDMNNGQTYIRRAEIFT